MWLQLIQDPNLRWILLGSIFLGLSSGVIGCFTYLRKQSLLGDAVAHSTLPGVALAFMITGSRNLWGLLLGALGTSLLATFLISYVTRKSRIKQDASLGIILSVFFSLGLMLLTIIQHSSRGNQSGLDKFLFGQAASMVRSDVNTIVIVSIILLFICFVFFKELKLLCFDFEFAKGLGLPVILLDHLIMLLMVIVVVTGIQIVGVILMVALLIIPATAARYWTDKLHIMVIISASFGVISGAIGTLISANVRNLPTGPVVVLISVCLFVFSLLFAPKRGLVVKLLLRKKLRFQQQSQLLQQELEMEAKHEY